MLVGIFFAPSSVELLSAGWVRADLVLINSTVGKTVGRNRAGRPAEVRVFRLLLELTSGLVSSNADIGTSLLVPILRTQLDGRLVSGTEGCEPNGSATKSK